MLFSRQQYVAVEFDIFRYKGLTVTLFHTSRQIFSKSDQLRLQCAAQGHVAPPSTRTPLEPSRLWPLRRHTHPGAWLHPLAGPPSPKRGSFPSSRPQMGAAMSTPFWANTCTECLPAAQHALGTQDTAEDKGTGSLPWGGPHSRSESCCVGEGHGWRPPQGTVCQAEPQGPQQCLSTVQGGPTHRPQRPSYT